MSPRAYETETVECHVCDGLGVDIHSPEDPLDWHGNRCTNCFGTGTETVCAQCLDSGDGCGACGWEAA